MASSMAMSTNDARDHWDLTTNTGTILVEYYLFIFFVSKISIRPLFMKGIAKAERPKRMEEMGISPKLIEEAAFMRVQLRDSLALGRITRQFIKQQFLFVIQD